MESARVDESGLVQSVFHSMASVFSSETVSAIMVEGCIRGASWPPLIWERCRRTLMISVTSAPLRTRSLLTADLSSREIPETGQMHWAETPPDMRQKTKSPFFARSAMASTSRPASRLDASGTG